MRTNVETTTTDKGNVLEAAVRSIESAIIHSMPGYSDGIFKIEGKKIITVAGVRHEIDVYVTVTHGNGYDSLFIFECKNWTAKVGKNEIIVFIEKIHDSNAHRGFFVARAFTKDAIAQAKRDSRVELLIAKDLDPAIIAAPWGPTLLSTENSKANVTLIGTEGALDGTLIEPKTTTFVLDTQSIDLEEFLQKVIFTFSQQAVMRCRAPFLTSSGEVCTTANEGVYPLQFGGEYSFEGKAAEVCGQPLLAIRIQGTADLVVEKSVVVSALDIGGRGRVLSMRCGQRGLRMEMQVAAIPIQ